MTVDSRSAIIAKLKKNKAAIKEAAKKTHGSGAFLSDREFMDLIGVPEESGTKMIVAAQLTRFRHGIDKNGQIYFAPNYVLTDGEHKGTPFSEFIGIPADKEKAQNAINSIFRVLQNLGVSTTDWDADDLEENLVNSAEELSEAKPSVRVAISRYINPNDENNHRMNLSVMGAVPSAPAGKKVSKSSKSVPVTEEQEYEEVAGDSEDEEVDLTQLGESADEGDEDAIGKLTELAEEAGLDVDDYPESWASLAEALAGSSTEEEEEEEETPPPKKVSKGKGKPKGTKGKADLGEGMVSIRVSSYDPETDEYVVTDNAGDDYQISASDIKW
jgi:hypothetical protein